MQMHGDRGWTHFGSRIFRRRQLPPGLAVAAALLLSSCHLMGSFKTGPEGRSMHDTDLQRLTREEAFDEALELTEPDDRGEIGDELLRLLHRGLLLHYAGRYEESNEALQRAEVIIDDRYTKSVSQAVLSLVTNDRALAWIPRDTERLMVNYYGALNYLALGDPEGAAVEVRRLSRILELAEEEDRDPEEMQMRELLRYFAGAVFEESGNRNDAAVAYRHVWSPADDLSDAPLRPRFLDLYGEDLPEAEPPQDDPWGPPPLDSIVARAAVPASLEPASLPAAIRGRGGDVVVLLEQGFVAHRVERSITVPLFPEEADALHDPDDDVRYAAASCVASRGFGDRYDFSDARGRSGKTWRTTSDGKCVVEGRTRSKDDSDRSDDPERQLYLMRVAWPEMVPSGLPSDLAILGLSIAADPGTVQVAAIDSIPIPIDALPADSESGAVPSAELLFGDSNPDEPIVARPAMSGSVSAAVIREFEDQLDLILIKTVARTALKYELAKGIEKELDDENEVLGDLAFITANAAAALFERADTRSWHLLPDEVSIVRLRLPAGVHSLALDVEAADGRTRRVDLGEIDLRDGDVRVLAARVWP